MIYVDPADPEAGYFGEDEVIECTGRFVMEDDCTMRHVVPADCSICEGPIPTDATLPLCSRCEATARAYAKYEIAARRYPDPEEPR